MLNKCPVCGSDTLSKLLSTVHRPVSVSYLPRSTDDSLACSTYPITVMQCQTCSHVFNATFESVDYEDGSMMFNDGAGWQQTIAHIAQKVNAMEAWHVVEIGAGEGDFLSRLQCRSKVAFEPCKRDKKPIDTLVRREYFTENTNITFYPRTTVVMRHVLEHIANPRTFLMHILRCRADNLVIEVPCCEVALERLRVEDWTYEHAHHFTKKSLTTLVELAGWKVGECEYVYGGEVVVCFAYADRAEEVRMTEIKDRFVELENVLIPEVHRQLTRLRANGGIVWWGGAGKGTMMLHQFWYKGDRVVDSDERKVGRYVPGLPIQIESPGVIRNEHSIICTSGWRASDIKIDARARGFGNDVLKITEGVIDRV